MRLLDFSLACTSEFICVWFAFLRLLSCEWMHSKASLAAAVRKNFKTPYPDVEVPVLAVYLRHSGAWVDAEPALNALIGGTAGDTLALPESLNKVVFHSNHAIACIWVPFRCYSLIFLCL